VSAHSLYVPRLAERVRAHVLSTEISWKCPNTRSKYRD